MKNGDRAILVNSDRLKDAGLQSQAGKEIILKYPVPGEENFRWEFIFVKPDSNWNYTYWVFKECIQLIPRTDWGNWMEGDKAVLTDFETLRAISMGGYLDKTVTLSRKLTDDEKNSRSYCAQYRKEDVWWIKTDAAGTASYYVPARCLQKPEQKQSTPFHSHELFGQQTQTTTKKETDSMYLYTITIIKTPSTLAQQAGETDSIIVGPVTELGKDDKSAIIKVAAKNAEAILKEEKSILRVVVSAGQ